jgi:small subunit ribosomal protein S18
MATKKNKECYFCANDIEVDYKDTHSLHKFVNFYVKILPGKRTGVCAWHQRKLAEAVKRARIMALMSHTHH